MLLDLLLLISHPVIRYLEELSILWFFLYFERDKVDDNLRLSLIESELFSIWPLKEHKPSDNIQGSRQRQVDNIVKQSNSKDEGRENEETTKEDKNLVQEKNEFEKIPLNFAVDAIYQKQDIDKHSQQHQSTDRWEYHEELPFNRVHISISLQGDADRYETDKDKNQKFLFLIISQNYQEV